MTIKADFEFLLHKAIHFAADKCEHVICAFHFPIMGLTPFCRKNGPAKYLLALMILTGLTKEISNAHKVNYLKYYQRQQNSNSLDRKFFLDGLHPSGKEVFTVGHTFERKMVLLTKVKVNCSFYCCNYKVRRKGTARDPPQLEHNKISL